MEPRVRPERKHGPKLLFNKAQYIGPRGGSSSAPTAGWGVGGLGWGWGLTLKGGGCEWGMGG